MGVKRLAVQHFVARSCSLRSRAARATASLGASQGFSCTAVCPLGL